MASPWCPDLRDPWASLIKHQFNGGNQATFARVNSVQDGVIYADVADLVPSSGPQIREPCEEIQIRTNVATQFKLLDWIGFHGRQQSNGQYQIEEGGSIWKVCTGFSDSPWTHVHLFAGAFQGWAQAFAWLQAKGMSEPARHVSIDNDFEVAKVWKVQGHQVIHDDVPVDFSTDCSKIGVCAGIENTTWYNLIRGELNLWITMSPPCQSWSGGGGMSGLNSDNGFCFVQASEVIQNLRPLVVTAECSDRIQNHLHFKIIRFLLQKAGYKLTWTSIEDHGQLVGMARKRWLAVYLRHDVDTLRVGGNFKLVAERLNWSHESFDFFCPQVVEEQLILTPPLLDLYGNQQYLPKGMNKGKTTTLTPEQVLQARKLQDHEIMPTLVASYTQQHLIPDKNLSEKGIYASLTTVGDHWAFFDPFKFIGLLGASTCVTIVIPKSVRIAFRQIGNSISVPHALMAILVAKSSISQCNTSIRASVVECFSERLIADECQVFQTKDMLIMCHESKVEALFASTEPVCFPSPSIAVTIGEVEHQVAETTTIHDFFVATGWESPQIEKFRCYENHKCIAIHCAINQLVPGEIHVTCRSATIAIMKLQSLHAPEVIHVAESPVAETLHDSTVPRTDDVDMEDDMHAEHNQSQESIANTWICTMSELECIESEAFRRPESIVSIFHFPEAQPTFMMCHEDNFEEEIAMQMQKKYGNVQIHALSHVPSWSEINFAVLVLHQVPQPDKACVVWVDQTKQELSVVEVPRSLRFCEVAPDTTHAMINALEIDPTKLSVVSNGDLVVTTQNPRHASERDLLAIAEGCRMGNDEMAWACLRMNEAQDHVFIIQPLCVDQRNLGEVYQNIVVQPVSMIVASDSCITKIMIPILEKGHWSAVEITMGQVIECKFIEGISTATEENLKFRLASIFRPSGKALKFVKVIVPAIQGLCGWTLLYRWSKEKDMRLFWNHDENHHCHAVKSFQDATREISLTSPLLEFSVKARTAFLLAHHGPVEVIGFGGADDEMENKSEQDPWQTNNSHLKDPWIQGVHTKKVSQSKWEDLSLPDNHPIVDKEGKRLFQITRQQMCNNHSGVAFATKSNLPDLLSKKPKGASAILIPVIDRSYFHRFSPQPQVSGPFELTVEDKIAGSAYKRQVLVVTIAQQVECRFEESSYKATLVELRELVFEVDSRLVSKDTLTLLKNQPSDTIRTLIHDQFMSNTLQNITLFGFKKWPKPNDAFLVQIIGKVAATARPTLLEFSGCGDVLVRDFISKGESINDTTVLPKFWECSKSGKEQALRTVAKTRGFCGVVCTKRGVALRSWAKDIASMRAVVMCEDARICDANMATIPKIKIESSGWPGNAAPKDIVQACLHATGQAPVPTRAYRSLGVNFWSLMFQTEPSLTRFSVCFNGCTAEILLTSEDQSKPIAKKPKEYPKARQATVNSAPSGSKDGPKQNSQDQIDRITVLENRFNVVERKQEALEVRMDQSFTSVQDQLRQILQAVQGPRAPDHAPTGLTPPPKVHKQSS
eukprot:Skav227747  [mRNA]  locus=scaffold3513:469499:474031:- [translate_table: standard]